MKVVHIVLTGGPCAGKSTGLAIIEQKLSEIGYKVITLSEEATNVINSGIKPTIGLDFQDMLIKLQLDRDNAYNNIIHNADFSEYKGIVVLYDRGILDGMAYCSKEEFNGLIKKHNMSIQDIYSKYDVVFHLVTAAIGAKEFYTTENNKARMETVEQAEITDRRTLDCWVGHPHLRVINNSGKTFENKMDKLMKEILSLLGEPEPFEIERKYLIKMPSADILNKIKANKQHIVQTYLKSPFNLERRIRQRGIDGDYTYYYTEKRKVDFGIRIENEHKISEREYIELLNSSDISKRPIIKDRYCFIYRDRYFELDIYPFWNDRAILEVELSSIENKIEIPSDLEIISDVTADETYSNKNLAMIDGSVQ